MKRQQEIVRLVFRQGEPVTFTDEGKGHFGYIHSESNGRPGWYYIRSLENRLHLVPWADIESAAEHALKASSPASWVRPGNEG